MNFPLFTYYPILRFRSRFPTIGSNNLFSHVITYPYIILLIIIFFN